MNQRLRLHSQKPSNTNRMVPGSAVEIVLFRPIETPVGRFYWNPDNAGMATLAGVTGGVLGLFAGAWLGLPLGNGLGSALLTLATSALSSAVFALNTLRA